MYLTRTKLVKGFGAGNYTEVNRTVEELFGSRAEKDPLTQEEINALDLSTKGLPEAANQLKECIAVRGQYSYWYSIFEDVGYWRKVNHVHSWFVDNVQDGVDECQLTIVPKEKLEELLRICKELDESKNSAKADELMPTRSGFFFGSTEYDEWYWQGIEETINILEKVLAETDFEQQVIFYQSSW